MEKARVIRPKFELGRRIIAVSDIHGNLPFFLALMDKVRLTPEDILVLDGDLLEKGRDSLPLLRHLMALSKTHTLYPICGNCDGLVLRFFESGELDQGFFASYLPQHPESTLRQMAREGGFEQWEDLPRLRRDLRAAFPREWAWLRAMPTILETEHLLFVHGGVPSLDRMEELDSWKCMKNDDFLGQGRSFPKWVIVGHWPVTLYDPSIPSSAPLFTWDRRIISIDGACVLKADGQLNALMLPSEDSEDFSWTAWDGLPAAAALDPQEASAGSLNIRWGRSALELLEHGEELSLCRHRETGRELYILNEYLRQGPKGLECEDSTDYRLPVSPGDLLTVVRRTKTGFLCKKQGVTGWYYGRLSDIME
ncbi:MAG: serine/threonine protein phosphatase [Lawsonibacter sp.]|nr:serine/threonine protein phosphatase [Lawsonibacter sp.]